MQTRDAGQRCLCWTQHAAESSHQTEQFRSMLTKYGTWTSSRVRLNNRRLAHNKGQYLLTGTALIYCLCLIWIVGFWLSFLNELCNLLQVLLIACFGVALWQGLSVGWGRHLFLLPEGLWKYQWVRISAGNCDGLDGELRKLQELLGLGDTVAGQVLLWRYPKGLFKERVQIASVDADIIGDICDLNGVAVIAPDVGLGFGDIVIGTPGVTFLKKIK